MNATLAPTGLSVPGLTAPAYMPSPGVCSVEAALREEDPDKQAAALLLIARDWFQAHQWYYGEAAQCEAFYAGFHWGFWSDRRGMWETTPLSRNPDEVRITVPVYEALVNQGAAMLTQDDPHFDTAAVKNDIRDVAASEATSQFVGYWWRNHKLTQKYHLSARSILNEGTALIYVRWDTDRSIREETREEFLTAEDGTISLSSVTESKSVGSLAWDVLPPDALAPDPAATCETDGEGVFIRVQRPRSWLYENFPEAYPDANTQQTPGYDTNTVQQDSTIIGRSSPIEPGGTYAGITSGGSAASTETLWVYTFYGRQTKVRPRGAMRVFVDGKMLVHDEDNPVYPASGEDATFEVSTHWPVIRAVCEERRGSYWGRGRGVGMIGPQKAINGLWSKALQHAAKVANAKIVMPAGLTDQMNDVQGQVIRYPRSVSPDAIRYLVPPAMVQEYGPLAGQMQAQMEYAIGINAATQGQLPAADTSGIAIGRLQQRDMTRMAPVKRSLDSAWAEAIKLGVRFWGRWATGTVKALVTGANSRTAVREFDSKSFSVTTDIQAFNNTFLPSDPSQRILWLQQFAQVVGQIQDPDLKRLIIRLTNIKDFAAFLENLDPDDSKARRNNLKLLRGEAPITLACDDPLTNVAVLEELLKSEEFEVAVEDQKAQNGGFSELEQRTLSLWAAFKQQASAAMAPPGMGQPPGDFAPPQGPPAPPPPPEAMGAPEAQPSVATSQPPVTEGVVSA